jgi:FKBP-type peptidyl-prolyl cis-trans isomerase FkpA
MRKHTAPLVAALVTMVGVVRVAGPVGLVGLACQGRLGHGAVELKTDEQKTFYALGVLVGKGRLQSLQLKPGELDLVLKGIADSAAGKEPAVEMQTFGPRVNQMVRERSLAHAAVERQENEQKAKAEKEKSKAFLEQAAKEPGAVKTDSGLIMTTLKPGTGESPKATDRVRVHYHGTLIDGTVFDSSVKRGEPAEFPLNGVIACWTEGVQKMKVGEKAKLICPSSIAYGDAGRPSIPPGATLIFEVELLAILK